MRMLRQEVSEREAGSEAPWPGHQEPSTVQYVGQASPRRGSRSRCRKIKYLAARLLEAGCQNERQGIGIAQLAVWKLFASEDAVIIKDPTNV